MYAVSWELFFISRLPSKNYDMNIVPGLGPQAPRTTFYNIICISCQKHMSRNYPWVLYIYLWSSTADFAHLTVVDLWCLCRWFIFLYFILRKLCLSFEAPAACTTSLGSLLLLVIVSGCRVHSCIIWGRGRTVIG